MSGKCYVNVSNYCFVATQSTQLMSTHLEEYGERKLWLSRFKDRNKTNILFLSKKFYFFCKVNCKRNYNMIFISKDIKDIA